MDRRATAKTEWPGAKIELRFLFSVIYLMKLVTVISAQARCSLDHFWLSVEKRFIYAIDNVVHKNLTCRCSGGIFFIASHTFVDTESNLFWVSSLNNVRNYVLLDQSNWESFFVCRLCRMLQICASQNGLFPYSRSETDDLRIPTWRYSLYFVQKNTVISRFNIIWLILQNETFYFDDNL